MPQRETEAERVRREWPLDTPGTIRYTSGADADTFPGEVQMSQEELNRQWRFIEASFQTYNNTAVWREFRVADWAPKVTSACGKHKEKEMCSQCGFGL